MFGIPVFIAGAFLFGIPMVRPAPVVRGDDSVNAWIGKPAPELSGGEWINSEAKKLSSLRGKVVLLEFWTYGCYNCRNTIPTLKTWHERFSGTDFEIIGVHTPEFDREKDFTSVQKEVSRLGIRYAVVTDNDYQTWDSFHQEYWPTQYLIDKKGIIRYVRIGEGDYDRTEQLIRSLIQE